MQNKLFINWKKYAQKELIWQFLNTSYDQDTCNKIDKQILIKLNEIDNFPQRLARLKIFIVENDNVMFLASFMAGIIAGVDIFLCDPSWGKQEWQQALNLVIPDLIFGEHLKLNLANNFTPLDSLIAQELDIPESLIMIPTGGTSGKVRFVMHTWKTLSASVFGFQRYFDCQKIDSFCTLPLYHVSGLMQFMRSFLTGGRLILCPYKLISSTPNFRYQNYFISLVPTQLQVLIDSIPEYLSQFKTILLGGAPPTSSLLNQARNHNLLLALTYGMTETASGIVALKPTDFLAGNDCVGKVLPHAQISIEPKTYSPLEHKIGLLKIKAESLSLGYYPQIFNSEFITDDLGYFDQSDYLYLVGRDSQKIITGGENVFPLEIENVIWSTQLVTDICIIGIRDPQWGQAITAVCVPQTPKYDLDLLKQKLRLQLANYKQPKHWVTVDSLPRNNRGKINYQKLQAIAKAKLSSAQLRDDQS